MVMSADDVTRIVGRSVQGRLVIEMRTADDPEWRIMYRLPENVSIAEGRRYIEEGLPIGRDMRDVEHRLVYERIETTREDVS